MGAQDFFIPKITEQQIATVALRAGGEVATIMLAEARKNAPQTNKYKASITSTPATQPALKGYGGKFVVDQTINADPELYKSDLNTSVFADVTFGSITYKDNAGKSVTTPSMTFQAILVSVVFPKNIVKTEIQGRDGTVKEYVGEGDAQITFRGIIVGANNQYPDAEIAALRAIIKSPYAIPVTCTHLLNLDIYNVVFEDSTLDQEEGSYSYQTFSLNAVSDIPQELLIF